MSEISSISVSDMREIDRLMVEEFGITITQMMEIAGFNIAKLARQMLNGFVLNKQIISVAGIGNNGGDALVAARYLTNWGAGVKVIVTDKSKLRDIPRKQLITLIKMGIEILDDFNEINNQFKKTELIIDGIIGYNLKANPKGKAKELIIAINKSQKPVLAIDVPSGLDAQTGRIGSPCIKALNTLALSLPKQGSVKLKAREVVGKLFVADMSVPDALYNKLRIKPTQIFSRSSIVEFK